MLSLRVLAVVLVLGGSLAFGVWWITGAPGTSFRGSLPEGTPALRTSQARLQADVQILAGDLGSRVLTAYPAALREAAAHVERSLTAAGYTVRRQTYEALGQKVDNLEAVRVGDQNPDEIVVIGAHYDTVPGTPGADDNASGVAVLLELARQLADRPLARTIRFVAFVNEEPPAFRTPIMGSVVYARSCADAGERVVAMLSLEMLGYFDERPETQAYPAGLGLFYPATADFVAFVGDFGARPLVRRAIGLFRAAESFPSEAIAGPAAVPGVDFSDHWAFRQAGYPAIMVTDTSFYRNPHYHQPTDTPDTLDFDRMARVTRGLSAVVAGLAGID